MGLKIETEYPWEGRVKISVTPGKASRFALNLRWPGWCEAATLSINGISINPLVKSDRGYIRLEREWHENDVIEFVMEVPVQRIEAHPMIKDCVGKLALQRGPVVYGFEGVDNGGTAAIELAAQLHLWVEGRADFLGGVRVILGDDAQGRGFVAIPFYTMANRAKSVQEVWTTQRGWKPSDAWWEGRLYRITNEITPKAIAPSPTEKDAK